MRFTLQRSHRVLLIALPTAATAGYMIALWHGIVALRHGSPLELLPLAALTVGLAIIALFWISYLRVPYEMELRPDDTAEFRALAGLQVVSLVEISYVDARIWNRGFITLRSPKGSIFIYRSMPGARH